MTSVAGPAPDLSDALGSAVAVTHTVGPQDTAVALASGDVGALGTPRLLAWLEEATCLALAPKLPSGWTSVGVRVEMEHQRASAVGADVVAEARVVGIDGVRVTFEVVAREGEKQIARGTVTRAIVDSAAFHARLGA